MAVSRKIHDMMERSSWIRRMFETGALLKEKHGRDRVFDFSLGNPNLDPPELFREVLMEHAADETPLRHGYMPNAGYPEVRAAVALRVSEEQGVTVEKEQVIMTCGAGGGLNVVLKCLLNPDDEVVCPIPYFIEYGFYTDNHGGTLVPVASREDFEPDVGAIERAITERTAALLINSPNNPSGHIVSEGALASIAELLARKSKETGRTIYLIGDEPYRKIVFDGHRVPSLFARYPHSIVVTSCSKDLSIPGERIGWIAVHPDADDAPSLVDGMILSNRVLGFVNAPALMQRTVARLQNTGVDPEIYRRKRDLLCEGLSDIGYSFRRPMGTFYLFPEAPGGDDLSFVQRLQEKLILTVPGRGFGLEGYFRIAFCVDDRVIVDSMPGFRKAFREEVSRRGAPHAAGS
jgi:aspartate aminotransferase